MKKALLKKRVETKEINIDSCALNQILEVKIKQPKQIEITRV